MKKRRVSLGAALYKAGNEESIEVMVSQDDVEKLRGIIVISYHPIRTYFEVMTFIRMLYRVHVGVRWRTGKIDLA